MSERLGLGGLCTLMEMHQQPGNSMGLLYVSERKCFYGSQMNKEVGFWYMSEQAGWVYSTCLNMEWVYSTWLNMEVDLWYTDEQEGGFMIYG